MNYIIHTGPGLGDMIQFISMARAIKETYPDAQVDFLMCADKNIWKLNMQIIELQKYVDNLYWYNKKDIKHDFKVIEELKKNKYDVGFVRIGNVKGKSSLWIYRIMRLVGCKKIVGTGTSKVDKEIVVPERSHYLKRNEMLLDAVGIKGRHDAISIDKDVADINWLNKLVNEKETVITLSVGTNAMVWNENGKKIIYDVKSWDYSRWIELAERLATDKFRVILIGGKKEKKEILDLNIDIPNCNNIINLIGETSIKESFSILIRSQLVVGSEGGMMHCASAVGTPTLTIMGGSDYKMWNPGGENSEMVNMYLECSPCFCTSRGAHCKEHECLNKISVRNVYDKCKSILC